MIIDTSALIAILRDEPEAKHWPLQLRKVLTVVYPQPILSKPHSFSDGGRSKVFSY
jgi:uncharacterized protein with PIN domain